MTTLFGKSWCSISVCALCNISVISHLDFGDGILNLIVQVPGHSKSSLETTYISKKNLVDIIAPYSYAVS